MKLVDYIAGEIVEGAEEDVLKVLEMKERDYSYCRIDMRNGAYIIYN